MNKIVKNTVLGLVSLTVMFSLTGCDSHSKEEVLNKVIKKHKITDKIKVDSFVYKEISKNDVVKVATYEYTIEGTMTKYHCDGFMPRKNSCYGDEYNIGSPFKVVGKSINLSTM